MFDRFISIDWSGAATETATVDLRIAMHERSTGVSSLVPRIKNKRTHRSWDRASCRLWLKERLGETSPTLVALDFGVSYPYGTDQALFGVQGWHAMVNRIAELYSQHGTARATAQAINALARFQGHGPYRFNESRTDFRFYLDHGIGYYRLTELLSPQAISQWYLGSGGTVGFHSITGLSAIADLIKERERGVIDFEIWPQEVRSPSGQKHVLVESYPSICPLPPQMAEGIDEHERDAWKVLCFMMEAAQGDRLARLFEIKEQPMGRIDGVTFDQQIQFEGYILGLC